MARSKHDLHNTANKDDELDEEARRKLIAWWVEQAMPLLEDLHDEGHGDGED